MDDQQYSVGVSLHPWLCRWWLRVRVLPMTHNGSAVHEFYVPWWAVPLDALHALIFGSSKLQ